MGSIMEKGHRVSMGDDIRCDTFRYVWIWRLWYCCSMGVDGSKNYIWRSGILSLYFGYDVD